MKANKALKRLAKIEASMSDVMERYSASAPHLREVLKDLKAAIARVKEAVNVQVSSRTAKKRVAAAKVGRAEKKAAPTLKKAAAKKVSVRASTAKSVKKRAPKKAAVKKMASAPAQAATEAAAQEFMPAPIGL